MEIPAWAVAVLVFIVTALGGVLIAMLAWMGNKLYEKVSEMSTTMVSIKDNLHDEIDAIRGSIGEIDTRVTRVETHLEIKGRKV